MTPTSLAIDLIRLHKDDTVAEAALINDVVEQVVIVFGAGLLDSHIIASACFDRRRHHGRTDAKREQTKDYIMYLFRETPAHVCRHADGHMYYFHKEVECSPECDVKYAQRQAPPRRAQCETCWTEVTTTGRCAMGCDD